MSTSPSQSRPTSNNVHDSDDATLTNNHPSKRARARVTVYPTIPNVMKAAVVLILAFWINALWLFGSFYNSAQRTHQLNVLVADFDGASVGSALLAAVAKFNGQPIYPTFEIIPANETSPQELLDRVWSGRVWGAIYSMAGATYRLEMALDDAAAAATYIAADALVYAGLEVRYSSVWSGYLLPNLMAVIQASEGIFNAESMVPLSKTLNATALSTTQAGIYFDPIAATFNNLAPFTFSSRNLYNTIGTVPSRPIPVLREYSSNLFLMTLNGLYQAQGIYAGATHRHLVLSRFIKGSLWTLLASLSVVGWEVAFDENLGLKAKNFFALWASTWFFAMGLFDLLDAVTTFLPMPAQTPVILSLIIMSVASTAFPIELCNHFFRIHYIFPAQAMWATNITAWSGGAVSRLYYTLPVLAVWFVIGKVLVVFAMKKKVNDARAAAKARGTPSPVEEKKVATEA